MAMPLTRDLSSDPRKAKELARSDQQNLQARGDGRVKPGGWRRAVGIATFGVGWVPRSVSESS
jgi:hypothetical protein